MNAEQNPARVFQPQRWIGAIVFLALFFLPLHFHFSVAAQVSKECSCVHGTRTQLALHDNVPIIAPLPRIAILTPPISKSVVSHQTRSHNVRGPPAALSA
jgi:hypothetical protein